MRNRNKGLGLENEQYANQTWSGLSRYQLDQLRSLSDAYALDVRAGDLQLIGNRWYVTHSGLLRLARRNRCNGIETEMVPQFCDPTIGRWVVKAIVYRSPRSKGFVGYGDADPGNVSDLVRGAEMRVAETRAVNRALRKAYAVGLCSVEEIGTTPEALKPGRNGDRNSNNDRADGQPARLRDRLLLLIRQHGLDADQVKAFAEAYCGNKPLREASREEITDFVEQLTELVTKDRQHALEVLAGYAVQRQAPPMKAAGEAAESEAA